MAYQAIGIGSSANDGTGDTLRIGADKVNDNFVEVYTKLGNGTALTSDTVTLNTATQTLTNKTLTSPNISVINNSGTLTLPSGSPDTLVGRATTDTLTNKTLTAPTINGVIGGTATSQTITTLTTAGITGTGGALEVTPDNHVLEIRGDGTNNGDVGQIQLKCSANSHGQKIKAQPHSANVTNEMLLPAGANSTLVSEVATQTLTNKTLTAPNINAATFSGILGGAIIGGIDAATGGGSSVALSPTTLISEITTTGAQDFSLVNGTAGQIKIITMVVDGGDATLTPATLSGGSTIVFNDVGDSVILVYHNTIGWKAIMNNGTTIS